MSNFDNILHAIFTCLDEPAKFNKQLLITTTEEAEGMELCGLFVPLHVANQLRTVFIEEAHVFSTHGDYRLSVWCLVDYALPALILVNSDCTSMAIFLNLFSPARTPVLVNCLLLHGFCI